MDIDSKDKIEVSHGDIPPSPTKELADDYTEEDFGRIRRKIDRYLLPLMFVCHGLQQVDKACISTQATFGIREDTGLVGQQYAWLTTIFYLTYLIFELPLVMVLQQYPMGRVLSFYIISWGFVVLGLGFAKNFAHLMVLRALQGVFECAVSPGFLLVVGTWYTTREHPSRALVFQCGFAGVATVTDLINYGIGTVSYSHPGFQAWRYMSFFLGGLTILVGGLSVVCLGTPSEVRWLSADEKKIATARIMENNTGHDRTGFKDWKWDQIKECLLDPAFWFVAANAFLNAVPGGGMTSFGAVIFTSFGFTNLQVLILNIPRYVFSASYAVFCGVMVTKRNGIRMWFMFFSLIPAIIGLLIMALLPNEPQHKWTKYIGLLLLCPSIIAVFFAWSLVPSNTAGRTKRTFVSTTTFVSYCVGNMVGTQVFQDKDAPMYIPGMIWCIVCLGAEMVVILLWRSLYVMRNKRRDKRMADLGISEEDRVKAGIEMGEQDCTDIENPFVSLPPPSYMYELTVS
ncbi:hypothetical protein M426DRAFT_263587 [Hypoxylon sp. CI-4A]|nr:hypothetical protein M426DRAFT_263587 [Hypoxylon sp. CI-4A]